MGHRRFEVKIVHIDNPNAEGRWVLRVVPDEWPGDDKAQPHMMKSPPDYRKEIMPGWHAVQIRETAPGPSDQPGTMHDTPGVPAFDTDWSQPIGPGRRF